jgi:uracil-DNA glycosylase
MLSQISATWKSILNDEFEKEYFKLLISKVENEYKSTICYPPKEFIFSAFNYCSFEDINVVILGQDPYHGENEANGLCFSVNDGVKIPPSLRNIFREINSDFDSVFYPTSGNLSRWANQGVLLLNSTLTVEQNKAGSHQKLGWEVFTDQVIKIISDQKVHVVFLLWGAFAIKKGKNIDTNKHLVLTSGHPSPLSANQGKWFGNKHFSKTNEYLLSIGEKPIEW